MNRIVIIIGLSLLFQNCSVCQNTKQIDISDSEMNYVFANLFTNGIYKKNLNEFWVSIYKYGDPKRRIIITEGTHEVTYNLLVSVTNDGEYANSKLYSIKNLLAPKIIGVNANNNFKNFIVEIEYGHSLKRKVEKFKFESIK